MLMMPRAITQVFGYYVSGSESEGTLRDNRAAYGRFRLMPRMMVDVSRIDTSCTLLGGYASHQAEAGPRKLHGCVHAIPHAVG